jgi:hypothetical protein
MDDNLLRNAFVATVNKLGIVEAFTKSHPKPRARLSIPRLLIITSAGLVIGFGLLMVIILVSMMVQSHQ